MKKKIIFQIIIFLIILILSTFVYYKYLKIEKIDKKIDKKIDDSESILKDEKVNDSELVQESDKNIIENIKYFKEDIYGNKFNLKAKKGEIIQNETKFVLLTDVSGVINLNNKSEILINSKFAKYNSINFNTEFYTDVKISYVNNVIRSDNLDLFF